MYLLIFNEDTSLRAKDWELLSVNLMEDVWYIIGNLKIVSCEFKDWYSIKGILSLHSTLVIFKILSLFTTNCFFCLSSLQIYGALVSKLNAASESEKGQLLLGL